MQNTSFLDISKTRLGKLLASEDIRIEHQSVEGPYFDVKERVLVLPLWKDMDADLYDLLIGHEVGHALYTPVSGWDKVVSEKGNAFKQVLNIVEDARIEKLMKDMYPGLRRPMYNGYTQLIERNFFPVPLEEMKFLPFIDRINVYFKLGARADIIFTEKEQKIVDRIEFAETWDEVLGIAEDLYEHALEEENETLEANADMQFEDENSVKEFLQEKFGDVEIPEKLSSELIETIRTTGNNDDSVSATVYQMTEKEKTLIDETAYPYKYLKLPKIKLQDWVIPSDVVHKVMNFSETYRRYETEIYNEFMNTNKAFISHMVKEFEMRRNAKQFAKARVSKTGDLDMNKIAYYKFAEDIFLQSTIVDRGKNHGMLMLIDMSGSMGDYMSETLQQLVALTMFCKKVNIPFDVYGFSNNGDAQEFNEVGITLPFNVLDDKRHDFREGCFVFTDKNFRMKQLIHSQMKTVEYTKAIKQLLMLANTYENHRRYYTSRYKEYANIPQSMHLSGTPLDEAIVVLTRIAQKFKKETKVEVLNTIILTDGESSRHIEYVIDGKIRGGQFTKTIIEDEATRNKVMCENSNITQNLLKLYQQVTDSNTIGYYLMNSSSYKSAITNKNYDYNYGTEHYLNYTQLNEKYSKEFVKHRFFALKATGYDSYYMLPGRELALSDMSISDVFVDTGNQKNNEKNLLKAFKKVSGNKKASRVFINHFIKHLV